jgi:hypothetical protein
VPGRKQEDLAAVADDGAAVAERAAAMLMSEQTEPTLQPERTLDPVDPKGSPEKQPWTFGGSYWPSRK